MNECEMYHYCRNNSDSIYVRYENKTCTLSGVPFAVAVGFIAKWATEGKVDRDTKQS